MNWLREKIAPRVKSLMSDEKYAKHFENKHLREVECSLTFSDGIGFELIEGPRRLIVPRRSRLPYYKFGIKSRLEFLREEYIGCTKINFQNGDIIIDCGANIGEFTLSVSSGIDVRVYAFEPDETEYSALSRNLEGKAVTINSALWCRDEELDIYLSNETGDTGVFQHKNTALKKTIRAHKLDTYLSEQSPNGVVRLLKIEAEGAEPEVLAGAKNTLKRTHYVAVDVGPERGETNETTLVEVANDLYSKGFNLTHFNHKRCTCLFENGLLSSK